MISIDKTKCVGCKICANVCPQNVISIIEGKAVIKFYKNCMECGACSLNCKYDAIILTKGTGCLGAIIKEDILKIVPKNSGCGCGIDDSTGIKEKSCC